MSGGGRHPVLLQRLPYGKHKPRYRSFYLEPLRAVNRGYVVVLQDVRGRHGSEGTFYPYRHEVDDGYDTVEWCASQPWCDGNVGMFGISYHGATQWLAATAAPPALKAMVPGVTADTYYDSWTYLGGVFQSFWITDWAASFVLDDIGRKPEDQPEAIAALRQWRRDPHAMSQHLPLKEMPALRGLADYYPVAYFLRSEGRANTLNGNGRLSLDPPRSAEPADHFLYNPLSPIPPFSCCRS